MLRRKIRHCLQSIAIILLVACTSKVDDLHFFKDLSANSAKKSLDTLEFNMFVNTKYLHTIDPEEKVFFSRIGNEKIIRDSTIFELFYYKNFYTNTELVGFWGKKDDIILFIPFDQQSCANEYLIVDYNNSKKEFRIDKGNHCEIINYPFIGKGYFYIKEDLSASRTNIKYYVLPPELTNITEENLVLFSSALFMVLDKKVGIIDLQYNFDVQEEPIIPWVSSFVNKDSLMAD